MRRETSCEERENSFGGGRERRGMKSWKKEKTRTGEGGGKKWHERGKRQEYEGEGVRDGRK